MLNLPIQEWCCLWLFISSIVFGLFSTYIIHGLERADALVPNLRGHATFSPTMSEYFVSIHMACATEHSWMSEDNMWESLFSFHHVVSRDQTQVVSQAWWPANAFACWAISVDLDILSFSLILCAPWGRDIMKHDVPRVARRWAAWHVWDSPDSPTQQGLFLGPHWVCGWCPLTYVLIVLA